MSGEPTIPEPNDAPITRREVLLLLEELISESEKVDYPEGDLSGCFGSYSIDSERFRGAIQERLS